MKTEVKVSICCTAYNHEKYIRQTLDGFVMQKTNFVFEIVINDDCSTDSTAHIIKEYENKYPNLFQPIYQTKNQYSQGVDMLRDIIIPHIHGKYIAICEGDDYWTDENKLQKQFDFMEAHPEYSGCGHNVLVCDNSNNKTTELHRVKQSTDISLEKLMQHGGGYIATCSLFLKKEIVTKMPQCFYVKEFSDFQLIVFSCIAGKFYCFSDIMGCYNYNSVGSWTSKFTMGKNALKIVEVNIKLLESINKFYDYKYNSALEVAIFNNKMNACIMQRDKKAYKILKKNPVYKKKSIIYKIKTFIKIYMPFTEKVLRFLFKRG